MLLQLMVSSFFQEEDVVIYIGWTSEEEEMGFHEVGWSEERDNVEIC